jgi:hypothetical protein
LESYLFELCGVVSHHDRSTAYFTNLERDIETDREREIETDRERERERERELIF